LGVMGNLPVKRSFTIKINLSLRPKRSRAVPLALGQVGHPPLQSFRTLFRRCRGGRCGGKGVLDGNLCENLW